MQKPGRNNLGEDLIKPQTVFYGPWQPAAPLNPRAVDIQDIDNGLVGEILVKALKKKGYQVYLMDLPAVSESGTVETIMEQYRLPVDAYLFCYYTPTVFVSYDQEAPKDHDLRSFSLYELVRSLSPGNDCVIWVGDRGQQSPHNSISHAFIYFSMAIFRANDKKTLMAEADSQVGGEVRPWITRCPPAPTDKDYWASPGIIQDLMVNNLKCRLQHQFPKAF